MIPGAADVMIWMAVTMMTTTMMVAMTMIRMAAKYVMFNILFDHGAHTNDG